jgi:diguanylate cyclase (GGDEF) domain
LIAGFAACYFIFALAISKQEADPIISLVIAVFFFGAIFVLLALKLFLHTFSSLEKINRSNSSGVMDEGSGVYNLRYFELRLNEEFDRYRRYNNPVSLLLIEIDHFKQLPSSNRQKKNERIFSEICNLLKKSCRVSDIIAKYGEDQLVVLLANTALFNARKAADKLRLIMEDKVFVVDDSSNTVAKPLNYTISIGVSTLQSDVKRASEIIRRADIALYKAKEKGRNRVVIYGE